jgi:hypothetical protein
MSRKQKQSGGNGYTINVNQAIGGMPLHTKYTSNCQPVFEGSLLDNNPNPYDPLLLNKNIQTGGRKSTKEDPFLHPVILQKGGNGDTQKISQFQAIKSVANILTPLSPKALLSTSMFIILDEVSKKNGKKAKQMGGYMDTLTSILAPLGRNNLLVLASLLLLHHFAVKNSKEKKEGKEGKDGKDIKLKLKDSKKLGGFYDVGSVLSNILAPLGVNTFGSSVILILINEAFKKRKSKLIHQQYGGNPLKSLIAPLGTSAFIATALLVLLQKLFTNKISQVKEKNKDRKKMMGGKLDKKLDSLFNLLSPISFNIFARESFLEKIKEKKQ